MIQWGVHNQALTSQAADSIIRSRPRVVVTTDVSSSRWPEIRQAAGIDLLVGRIVRDDADLLPTPEQAAERYYAEARSKMLAAPAISLWIGPWNERLYAHGDLANRARAEQRYCEIAAADGLQIGVGGFSVGTPEPGALDEYGPALDLAAWLVVHEYWTLGRLEVPWWAGRWRRLVEALPGHLRRPVLIAEAGLDYHVLGRGDAESGWRANGVEISDYVRDLDAYRLQLVADVEAIGARTGTAPTVAVCLYQVGCRSPWESFELEAVPEIEAWLAARRDDPQPPASRGHTSIPAPAPVPEAQEEVRMALNPFVEWIRELGTTPDGGSLAPGESSSLAAFLRHRRAVGETAERAVEHVFRALLAPKA